MSKFKMGDRVRLKEDFDTIKAGTLGVVEFLADPKTPYDVFVRFSTQVNQTLLYDEEVELVCAPTTFATRVEATLGAIGEMLVEKNKAYGNSALDPVRVFSTGSAAESLAQRIDDKLSRIARGTEFAGEDTVDDLIGYLVLYKMAREDEQ